LSSAPLAPLSGELLDVEVPPRSQHLRPQPPSRPGLLDRLFQIRPLLLIFLIDVNEGGLRPNGEGCDQAAFKELMGIVLEEIPVLEGSGLVLAGIADKIPLFDAMMQHLVPLGSRREPGPAAPAQPRPPDLRHDSFAAELHDAFAPGVIPAHAQVWLDLPRRPFELVQQPGFGRGHRSLLPLETRNPIESVRSCYYKATFPSSSSRKTLFGPDSQAFRGMDCGASGESVKLMLRRLVQEWGPVATGPLAHIGRTYRSKHHAPHDEPRRVSEALGGVGRSRRRTLVSTRR